MKKGRETYILPDINWSGLLDNIAREAHSGAVIITYTREMYDLCMEKLHILERTDVAVELEQ